MRVPDVLRVEARRRQMRVPLRLEESQPPGGLLQTAQGEILLFKFRPTVS